MNPLRFILFTLFCLSAASLPAQDVQAYLNRRWVQVGEELRIILTVRGGLPTSAPEFPEMESFAMGMREISTRKEGALRTTVFEQVYIAEQAGTRVIPPLVVPFQDRVLRVSPGVVTVHPASEVSMAGYQPAPLDASLRWTFTDSIRARGQVQHAVLSLLVPEDQQNNIHWDLGALAELADSLRRSPAGKWILRDSMIQSLDAPITAESGLWQFPLYEVWLGCAEPGDQTMPAAQMRIERRWSRKTMYRGGRSPAPRWEDEFLPVAGSGWKNSLLSVPVPAPAAASGPLQLSAEWGPPNIQTGEPMDLTLRLQGPVYMGLVPAPHLDLPASIVLRGPEVHTFYEIQGQRLTGTKTFSFSLYPAEPGRYSLSPATLHWPDPDLMKVDSSEVALPVMMVEGAPIPQLLRQNQVEQFYAARIHAGADSQLPSRTWIKPVSVGLMILALGWFVFVLRYHLGLRTHRRHQQLKSRRFPGA